MTEIKKHQISKPKPLLEATRVVQNFHVGGGEVQALRDISFRIHPKTFTIIYGPSGSGKSTLLNVIAGLQPPSEGQVFVQGTDLYSLDADARANFRSQFMGMVYQANYWIKSLNVIDNVAMPLYLHGTPRDEAVDRAYASLKRVGMESHAKVHPTVLSGGQQQRVSMARALISEPEVVVADEPTGNLDTKNGDMIMSLLHSITHDLNRTVVLVTHNLEYLPLSDHQLYIKDGMLLETFGIVKNPAQAVASEMRERTQAIKAIQGLK